MSEIIVKIVAGALGGISATGPMTILMEFLHRRLPPSQQYALPPREITQKLADGAGLAPALHRPEGASLVLLSHFAYGGAAGVLYAILRPFRSRGVLSGIVFGAFLWVISYFGLLPAVSILRSAEKHPPRRNILMLLAHLLWGLFLGVFVGEILSDRKERRGALVSDSPEPDRDRVG